MLMIHNYKILKYTTLNCICLLTCCTYTVLQCKGKLHIRLYYIESSDTVKFSNETLFINLD